MGKVLKNEMCGGAKYVSGLAHQLLSSAANKDWETTEEQWLLYICWQMH